MSFRLGGVLTCLIAAVSSAQQAAREPELPVFRAQSKLVVVPFQVSHGKGYLTGLKAADIELREDGVPRKFSIFEGPQEHSALELVLVFDTTTWPMGGDWNLQALYAFAEKWDQAMSRTLLERGEEDIRVSIYHFDGVRLERLGRGVHDPAELAGLFHRLLAPIYGNDVTASQREQIAVAIEAAKVPMGDRAVEKLFRATDLTPPLGTPISLELPPDSRILAATEWPGTGHRGWPLEAAIGALRDASAQPDKALRVMVEFSRGTGGTTTGAEDVAEEAVALGVPVYPVLMNYQEVLDRVDQLDGSRTTDGGRGAARVGTPHERNAGVRMMDAFARLGSLTGGKSFEGGRESMSAKDVLAVLETVREEGLARARSQYHVGFAPPASAGSVREHKLEVRLVSKSVGKVTGGKRRVIY